MKLFTLLSIGTAFLLSCATNKKLSTFTTPLYETKWLLRKIHSDAGTETVQTNAFIKFDELKKSAGGNGSCNTFGSSVTIKKNEIKFNNTFSTKMYCEPVQKTEDSFFKQLEKANRFEINSNTLSLYQDDTVLLEFISE